MSRGASLFFNYSGYNLVNVLNVFSAFLGVSSVFPKIAWCLQQVPPLQRASLLFQCAASAHSIPSQSDLGQDSQVVCHQLTPCSSKKPGTLNRPAHCYCVALALHICCVFVALALRMHCACVMRALRMRCDVKFLFVSTVSDCRECVFTT